MSDDEQTLLKLLGYVYLQSALPDKAAVVLAALNVVHPGQPQVLLGLALAQLRCGKPGLALETLDQLAMSGAVDDAFHLIRGRALYAQNRFDEAAASMRSYIQLRTNVSAPSMTF
jgi:hypothetical protein